MKFDVKTGWFYSTTINPQRKNNILRIYYRGELKHQGELNYIPGQVSVESIIRKIKKGVK